MNYSTTIAGLIGAVLLPILAQWGFSEACSTEVLGLSTPFLLSLPGIAMAWIGRVKAGGIHFSGMRK